MASSANTAPRWASLADRLNPNRAAFDPKFKEEWKKLDKASKKEIIDEDKRQIRLLQERAKPLPFTTDANDHCETSKTAYKHIVPFLNLVAKRLNKEPSELKIYDPYYCAGAVVNHLKELGFGKVHNQPDDFYEVIKEGKVPPHDILITNPPYSGDHFDRLKKFLDSNQKPHLLLLPDHFQVDSKSYAFLRPKERYHYWTPRGMRPEDDSKKRKHRNLVLGSRNSPFPSQWCINLEPLIPKNELLNVVKLEEGCTLQSDAVRNDQEGAKFRIKADSTTDEACGKQRKKKRKKKKRVE